MLLAVPSTLQRRLHSKEFDSASSEDHVGMCIVIDGKAGYQERGWIDYNVLAGIRKWVTPSNQIGIVFIIVLTSVGFFAHIT